MPFVHRVMTLLVAGAMCWIGVLIMLGKVPVGRVQRTTLGMTPDRDVWQWRDEPRRWVQIAARIFGVVPLLGGLHLLWTMN